MQDAVLFSVIIFGLSHGINPSHGWTVAALYSIRSKRPLLNSILSSSIIGGAHFLSSIVVMVAFLFVTQFVEIPKDYMNYVVAVALGILAYMFWKEKTEDLTETQHGHFHSDTEQMEHEHLHWHKETGNHFHIHAHQKIMMRLTLGAIAGFALALGFAHEEEFVILSLAVGGIEPILLMIAYASAVASALIGITILAVKVYTVIEKRILHYIKYLPKISAIMLAFMAVGFALNIF